MTSRERYIAAYHREEPDHVPIRVWGAWPGVAQVHPSYEPIINAALEKTDLVAPWYPDTGLFLSATKDVPVHETVRASAHEHYRECVTVIETPEGLLTSGFLFSEDGHPGHASKYLVETVEEARCFLSIPYVPMRPDCSSFNKTETELGHRGIVTCLPGRNASGNIHGLLGSETFAVWSVTERELLRELVEAMHARVMDYLRYLIGQGVGPFFGYAGAEICIPPLQSVKDFRELVVRYDREIADTIHDAGGFLWVHSHGKMGPVLEGFVEMGADCLNPIEPPPMGDLTLKQARERIGHALCLEGNIEKGDFHDETPDAIRRKVHEAIRQGAPGGGFILCPTSGFQDWPVCTDRLRDNFLAFIEAGLEYGQYPVKG